MTTPDTHVPAMHRYANTSGDSGVTAFELRPGAVVVQFGDGWKYEYTEASAGRRAIRQMRRMAVMGQGLSAYISQHVRQHYSRKFR